MKLSIPEALKSELPQTTFGKVLGVTPVVMTVVATLLAGLASGEMTRAQYARSLAAQQQSKAGDQWSFFQAKRLRSALQRSSLDLLQNTALTRPVSQATVEGVIAGTEANSFLQSSGGKAALEVLESGHLPSGVPVAIEIPQIKEVVKAIEESKPDAEITALVIPLQDPAISEWLRTAREQVSKLEVSLAPINGAIDQLEAQASRKEATQQRSPAIPSHARDITAARLRYNVLRYDAEARLNQSVANLYELQVRKSNLKAERHHRRSQRFFLGMLAAQAAVIIATFSLAARNKNLMWAIAAAAGLIAVGFAIYVFLYV